MVRGCPDQGSGAQLGVVRDAGQIVALVFAYGLQDIDDVLYQYSAGPEVAEFSMDRVRRLA